MKNLIIILFLAQFAFIGLSAQAQTKKTTKTPVKSSKTTPAKAPIKKAADKKNETKTVNTNVEQQRVAHVATNATDYKTALGVKFLYGIAITGKHFFKEQHAAEAIVRYNGLSGLGTDINLTALYEYHGKINSLVGLKWYVGGGAYVGNTSFKNNFNAAVNTSNFYLGLAGVLGLEYKINSLPIAISADWQPIFILKDGDDNTGFTAENGGIGVKYTF